MPAILTHNLFGRDVYSESYETIGGSKDEFDSFIIGCQGPDVLFFTHLDPRQKTSWNLGTKMHRCDPVQLLSAFASAVRKLPEDAYAIGRSYLYGLICHYVLDSEMHPFIYAQQRAIESAGVKGLNESHGHEIHAEIESELDILALSVKRGETIADYPPEKYALRISRWPARIISYIYKNAASQNPLNCTISENAFVSGLSAYRLVLGTLHSTSGIKRATLGAIERMFRDHSFMQAMSHRNVVLFESDFDNRSHEPWTNPWTGNVERTSFWDIYDSSLKKAIGCIRAIDLSDKGSCMAIFEKLTGRLNFNGAPTFAVLLEVEDIHKDTMHEDI